VSPQDIQVIELHDCFSTNELLTYEGLGLCPIGKAGELVDKGDNTYGGKWVINPSGGLISKGHPLGATGLAQCAELNWQLRGLAEKRQVKGAKIALQHNLGLGSACVVTIYKLADFGPSSPSVVSSESGDSTGAPKKAASAAAAAAAAAPAPAKVEAAPKAEAPTAKPSAPAGAGGKFKSEAILDELKKKLSADLVSKVKAVYRFDITNGSASRSWVIDLKNGNGKVEESGGAADCIIALKDDDFVAMFTGKLNPQNAFMKGQLKIKGNMMLAQKLSLLTTQQAKL